MSRAISSRSRHSVITVFVFCKLQIFRHTKPHELFANKHASCLQLGLRKRRLLHRIRSANEIKNNVQVRRTNCNVQNNSSLTQMQII